MQGIRVKGATLAHPVLVAADVVPDLAIAFEDDGAGHHVVEEGAVMAYQQQGALEFHEYLFEQFQGFHVEVVGGLVQHQEIGWLAEQARQYEPVLFAAGERLYRLANARRFEQEVLQVADDMHVAAIDRDMVGATGEIVLHGFFRVELLAQLVEVGNLDLRSRLHLAVIRLQLAQQDLQQGGFADAVRADQADAVAAHDSDGEIVDQGLVAITMANALGFHHDLAGHLALVQRDLCIALYIQARPDFLAHFLQGTDAAFIACAPGLDALAYPLLFPRQFLVELGIGLGFGGQLLVAVCQEGLVIVLPVNQLATIQFHDAVGGALQESAVVCDQDDGAAKIQQQFFQPLDSGYVEMVGGLIQQEDVGVADQGAGQGGAAGPAAGKGGHEIVGGHVELADHNLHTVLELPAVGTIDLVLQAGEFFHVGVGRRYKLVVLAEQGAGLCQAPGDEIVYGFTGLVGQFLLQHGDTGAGLDPAFTAVRPDIAMQQFQQ